MKTKQQGLGSLLILLMTFMGLAGFGLAEQGKPREVPSQNPVTWQEKAVEYARIMSQVKWVPVADGIPIRGGKFFQKGTEYTGVPYSNGGHEGRYIGFDVFLKTFLAAVQNPHSVLYTENLSGQKRNSAGYYGLVCSSYTSYALQCTTPYPSYHHIPPHRAGVERVDVQSAQAAEIGDIIYTPPGGAHVEIVTRITKDDEGTVTHVRVEDSRPATTRTANRSAASFDSHISSGGRKLYRITDLDAWRGSNRAESFLFPDYEKDSALPAINRVLLLDRGDWVPYHKNQAVKFNVMDKLSCCSLGQIGAYSFENSRRTLS